MIRSVLVFSAVWVAVLGTAATTARAQLLSPGALTNAHASIDGDDHCGKCHESGKQVVDRLCLACHKDLAGELAANRGLHGRQYKNKPCEQCHVEHLGKKAKLVRWPGGAMAKLDHALTGWKLEGAHTRPSCTKCHTRTSPQGKRQFLATSTACASCHKDPHESRFGSNCSQCHGVSDWKQVDRASFDHKLARFALTGKHSRVACEKCHTGAPPKWRPLPFSTCDSCHKDPHAGNFKPKPCAACHTTASWEVAADTMRGSHPGLSLRAGHARVACEKCHDRGNNKKPSKGAACVKCHRPVHIARFGTRCESCHARIRWVGLKESVGRDNHDKTRFPLAGKHTATTCEGCHPPSKPRRARFKNLEFDRCAACHRDAHNGEFQARSGGECAPCHTVAGFLPTRFGIANHATTRFELVGRHRATPCSKCHLGPRPRVSFAVAKQACADCHANPHGDQFSAEMAKGGCASCHSPTDWHRPNIEHSIWPLVGAHASAPCAGCHRSQERGAEPASYRGVPRTCEGCHDDVHAGQFRQSAPAKTCDQCHSVTAFKIATTFDHQTTSFVLDGKHKAVACGRCHPSVALRNGAAAVRWRLGYRQCKDCHANPHEETP